MTYWDQTYLLFVTPLVYRAVTRGLHLCLLLASFWSMPQLHFSSFISHPLFAANWLWAFLSSVFPPWCPEESCLYIVIWVPSKYMAKPVTTSSDEDCGHVILQLAPVERYWFEMLSGQNILKILLRDFVWFRSLALWSIQKGCSVCIVLVCFVLYWLDLQTVGFEIQLLPWIVCLISVSAPPTVVTLLPKYVKVLVH